MLNESVIKKWVTSAIDESLKCKGILNGRQYYKNVEKVLYSLDKLQVKLENDRQDIADLKREHENHSAVHGIKKPEGPALDDVIRHKQKVANRERAMLRTQEEISKVYRNLKQIEGDEWYPLIQKLYFEHKQMDVVATEMYCSISTVHRNRKRLINDLCILFYGADALEG